MILQDKAGCGTVSCQLLFVTDVHFHSCLTGNTVGKLIVIYLMIFFCPIFFLCEFAGLFVFSTGL